MIKKLDPQKTALLVIDMQKDFYASNGSAAIRGKQISQMQSLPEKINYFVKSAKDLGLKITIFTKYLSGKNITPVNLKEIFDTYDYKLSCEKGSGFEEFEGVEIWIQT